MKTAYDFRTIARNVLRGKWSLAVIVGLVASILGAIGDNGPEFKINIDTSNVNFSFNFAGQDVFSTTGIWFASGIGAFIVVAIFMAVIYFVLGSFTGVGYARFNLNMVDGQPAEFENLFKYFAYWKTTAVTRVLRTIYVLLWSLLFIIPGIIASYNYMMTDYILADNPELDSSRALEISKEMMYGNRFRFFCLQLSFIGWDILATIPFGIGHLWLTPYKQASFAAFYREVSGTEETEI